MKRFLLVFTVCLLAACAAAPIQIPIPKPAEPSQLSDPPRIIVFTPTDEPILNPERGFFLPTDILDVEDYGGIRVTGSTLIRSYVRLDAYREVDLPQDFLDKIDQRLAAVREGGVKAVLRFSYNFGPYPNSEPDASKAQMLRHIAQLTPVLQKNADVIAWMEAGFVGAWGEWHTSTHGIDKSMDDKREIVSALLRALPPTRMIQLRYPTDMIRMWPQPLRYDDAFSQTDQARVGHHNDCFLASDTDQGTYEREGKMTRDSDQTYLAESTQYTPVGGETCNLNPPRSDCETALREMVLLHFTEINLSYHTQVVKGWRKQKCFDEINRRLGYRISLVEASVITTVHAGGSFTFSISLKNTGFASMVNPRMIYAVFDGPQRLVIPLDPKFTDPRRWQAGAQQAFGGTVDIPANAKPGVYRFALWLPDADPRLQNDPRYAVRFANKDMWDEQNGFNVIGTVEIE